MREVKKEEKNKGITLMALIITIIVLMILASISLVMLTGGEGIMGRASEAARETEASQGKEELERYYLESVGKDKYGEVDIDEYLDYLEDVGVNTEEDEEGKK